MPNIVDSTEQFAANLRKSRRMPIKALHVDKSSILKKRFNEENQRKDDDVMDGWAKGASGHRDFGQNKKVATQSIEDVTKMET
jgi:hypothetical protein